MTFLFLLIVTCDSLAQETEKFAKKIADNMCTCLSEVDKYELLKSKLDSCYDKEINQAAINATPEEIKIIGSITEFNKVKSSLEGLIKSNCDVVRQLVEKHVQASRSAKAFPTNFDSKEYKQARKRPEEWNGKIVALDGEILEVKYPLPNKPYLKVRMGDGQVIWIGSMVSSSYDKVGNHVRFLGYFSVTSKDDFSGTYHDFGFHIVAFGEIDHRTKQLAMLPGSESQIKEWSAGQIPKGK